MVGRELAQRNIRLVFGGSHSGLMGIVSDACLQAGGEVTGVIPQFLVEKEIAHTGLSDLRIVTSMHERKATMARLSDAFLALPGGFGTFEELFETLTWIQLGIQKKRCLLLNVRGYFDGLLQFADHAVAEGFLRARNRELLHVSQDVGELLSLLDG